MKITKEEIVKLIKEELESEEVLESEDEFELDGL